MWPFVLQIVSVNIFLSSFGDCDANKDAVKALSMVYTTESQSVNGKWCLNDCVDGRCAVDIDVVEECHRSNNPAPTYYNTGQRYTDQRKCTSRCMKLSGDARPRCFVDDNWDKLDFCNPDLTNSFEYRDYTLADGPCSNDCRGTAEDPSNGTCNDISGNSKRCYFDKIFYESAKSVSGFKCHGECLRHGESAYSWCYYNVSKWDYCARPALYNTPCFNCTTTIRRQLQETVSNYAERMERDPSLKTVGVSDTNNPVYSYTYKEIMTPDGPVKLPLVVRARIYRSHIKPRNSRGNDAISFISRENCRLMGMTEEDVFGYLIAYKFGGPTDFYNFVPMTRKIHIGSESGGTINAPSAWAFTEREIAEFIGSENGQVNIVVVLRYNLNDHAYPYRPYRIGWGQWGLTSNGDVVLKCSNYWNTHNK